MANEFPSRYPTLNHFIHASGVITSDQLRNLTHNGRIDHHRVVLDQAVIMGLMTPQDILNQSTHQREIITTEQYPSFESLLRVRDMIRNLRLAPIRPAPVQAEYERMSRATFLDIVKRYYLHDTTISLVREMFPHDLPVDAEQFVVWDFADGEDYFLAQFIAEFVQLRGSTPDDIILFERSRQSETEFVRAAIPEIRHLHLWMKSSVDNK